MKNKREIFHALLPGPRTSHVSHLHVLVLGWSGAPANTRVPQFGHHYFRRASTTLFCRVKYTEKPAALR